MFLSFVSLYLVWLFLVWLLFALLVGFWAQNWNRSFATWLLIAILLGPLIGAVALLIKGAITRKCQACGENVKLEAKVCRFCKTELPEISQATPDKLSNFNIAEDGVYLFFGGLVLIGLIAAFIAKNQDPTTVAKPLPELNGSPSFDMQVKISNYISAERDLFDVKVLSCLAKAGDWHTKCSFEAKTKKGESISDSVEFLNNNGEIIAPPKDKARKN